MWHPCVAPTQNWRSTFAGGDRVDILAFDGGVDECQGGAAEGFVLAKDEGEVTADVRVGDGNRSEHLGLDILLHMGAGDEAHADVRGHEALEQFAGIEFHGVLRLEPAFVEEIFERVASVYSLGHHQGKFGDFGDGGRFHFGQRMLRWGNNDQFIPMNEDYGEPVVADGKRNDAEVDGIVDYRFQNLAIVGALDVDGDIGVLLLEFGKDFGKDVQAGAFVGADDDLAAGHALGLGDGGQDDLAGFKCFFSILLEDLARSGDRNLAAGAVEELGPDLLLQGANLGGDRWLGAEALLRGTGKRREPCDFQKGF